MFSSSVNMWVIAAVWVAFALVPVRNSSARRIWIVLTLAISALVVGGTVVAAAQEEDDTYTDLIPDVLLIFGPGALAALIRLALSKPDPTPPTA
ncbi:hypothetical protein ACFVIM_01560 [Streptomyces sp. NPDC057638]|uniref:hypothetical protein n=1 Tax=Streptomyces sp. NPDC057638 TaxID=3346190 RepID=UPI0036C146F6